mmetsp:Transcript_10369/g.16625  ORF Transcript_10369/g.16625 Transcript_10369/m.16625 type:complete len:414 (+) Transcript_10369:215-1456(+)
MVLQRPCVELRGIALEAKRKGQHKQKQIRHAASSSAPSSSIESKLMMTDDMAITRLAAILAEKQQELGGSSYSHYNTSSEMFMGNIRYFVPEQIQKKERLGKGTFGEAWLATIDSIPDKSTVLKIPLSEGGLDDDSLRELGAMAALKPHKNIVEFLGVVTIEKKLCFLTGYCARGSLDRLHHKYDMTSERKFLVIASNIADGLEHLHSNDIIHRDLACRNLLMTEDGCVVICDYGLSKKLTANQSSYKVNTSKFPWPWTSPQSLETHRFDKAADIWSFGVTLWELLTKGATPYAEHCLASSSLEVMKGIKEGKVSLKVPNDSPEVCRDLVADCLKYETKARPSAVVLARKIRMLLNDKQPYQQSGDIEVVPYAAASAVENYGEAVPGAVAASDYAHGEDFEVEYAQPAPPGGP